ncbi:MAG TPA: hypothetical protein VH599_20130 [Ktedonobacterales bacterium]
MSQPTRRLGAVFVLLALLMIAALSGCQSDTRGASQTPTAASSPGTVGSATPGGTPTVGGTPSPTPIPFTACSGKLPDIVIPDNAVQVGSTAITGATTSCAYRIPQDLKTLDDFFKTQMGKNHWRLLHDNPEGPQGLVQEYFKAQRFATITLTQHESDTQTTDVTISVEASK